MNRIALTSIAALIALAATGCSSSVQAKPGAPESPAASSAAASAPATPSTKPTPKSALIVKFGETIEYADGVKVKIEHAGSGTASAYAAPQAARGAEFQLFKITLTNGTADAFDPAVFYETAVFGTAGTPAEKVFDSSQGIGSGSFSGLVVPGGTQTVTSGWQIPAAELKTTTFTVRPSFKHAQAIVTGGL